MEELIKEYGEAVGSLLGALVTILGLYLTLRRRSKTKELIQEEKVVYVRFQYIRPKDYPPVYLKKISRLNQEIPIHSELTLYRFNKFNKECEVEITDSSTEGVIDDLRVVYPWTPRFVTHKSRSNDPKEISRKVSGSDTYMTISTYCNGFQDGEEDYAIMAEYDTKTARLIVDFSSIPDLDQLFTKPPDAYRYFDPEKKKETPISGILQISPGVYMIEALNMKRTEIIELDFHVDWEHMSGEKRNVTVDKLNQ